MSSFRDDDDDDDDTEENTNIINPLVDADTEFMDTQPSPLHGNFYTNLSRLKIHCFYYVGTEK